MTHHPFRDLEVHAFEGVGSAAGRAVARFYPYDAVPMIFTGASVDEVTDKAEAFRAETIEKHEASFIARTEALEKARAARKAVTK